MKIKEVIGLTGLTDRAIRLYIENGLIAPENQKSYTGRNSYEFTDADVEVLRQIALLRKAEFSLEQIKALRAGGESAQKTLREYLEAKKEALTTGQKIVSALQTLPADQSPTLEDICHRIEAGLQEKPLPPEDIKPSAEERWKKWLMRIASGLFLALWGLLSIGVFLDYQEHFPFQKFYRSPAHYIGVAYLLIPIVLSIIVLFLYRKPQLNRKKKSKRRITALILLFAAFIVAVQPIGLAAINFLPPVYSETDNPTNYLVLGTYTRAHGDSIHSLFPATIPDSTVAEDSRWFPPDKFPETTRYYYHFQDVLDPCFDIYAEWVLPEEEYDAELQRIRTHYPDGPYEQVQWGNWVCYNYSSDLLEEAAALDSYSYIIFAYNDTTSTVRYIAAQSVDWGDSIDPYFLSLEW